MLTKRGSSITLYWVTSESIEKCDELIPGNLEAVKGTMKIHQVVSSQPAKITHREVSCFCKRLATSPCPCYQPVTVDLKATIRQIENPSSSPPDLCGRFVVVTNDELPYVGQVLKVVEEELQISCMRQSGDNNLFFWPQTLDVTFYVRKDIHTVISETEPATSHFSKLTCQGWVMFRNAWG